MTRTHIIAGDGTRFVPQQRKWVLLRATAYITFLVITALFLSAAVIGFHRAAIEGTPSPAASSITLPKPLPAALRACRTVPTRFQGYCIGLYLRPAYTINRVYTPAGPALVKECLDQYRGGELAYCLTQPIN
jgi:hypothetical protein